MKNIVHLLDVVDKVRDSVALGLMSDPGLSKTSQVKQWAEDNGRRYCELIISQRMPSEISGMPMPVPETQRMEIFDFQTLLDLKDGDVLAFDEFTNGNIQTLNACLTLIQERTMLSGKKLPSLVIVAMGNPQGRCDLLPQTKQRFLWVNVNWHEKTWSDYMRRKWGFSPNKALLRMITEQYKHQFDAKGVFNYVTPRTVENLVRIASTIAEDDPFWSALDDTMVAVVKEIYLSRTQDKDLADLKQKLLSLVSVLSIAHPDEETQIDIRDLVREIEQSCTLRDLRSRMRAFEKTGMLPDFFDMMRSAKDGDDGD